GKQPSTYTLSWSLRRDGLCLRVDDAHTADVIRVPDARAEAGGRRRGHRRRRGDRELHAHRRFRGCAHGAAAPRIRSGDEAAPTVAARAWAVNAELSGFEALCQHSPEQGVHGPYLPVHKTRPPVCLRNSQVPHASSTAADAASTPSATGSSAVHPSTTRMRMLAIA